MDDFAKKVIEGNGISTPAICSQAFSKHFEDAINTDWFVKGKFYEAIFYKDSIEHIALFDGSGNLIEYRKSLPFALLPEKIKSLVEESGEIMNALLKNKRNSIEYEVILRDKFLKRHLILLTDSGKIINEKIL